jgi:membrane peptidoglycan carboxypeptidase
VIDTDLRDAAHATRLHVLPEAPARPCCDNNKATNALRTELLDMLDVPIWYDLDRLDSTGYTTIDLPAQKRVSDVLVQLNDPDFVKAHHLLGRHLLHTTRNLDVNYSVVLYERDADSNFCGCMQTA